MILTLERIRIPAWSTVGYGVGVDEDGRRVQFVGDHHPLRQLGETLAVATEPIEVEVTDWQVLSIEETSR